MVSCCVYGCNKRSGRDKISFHRFPDDPKLRELWIKAVNRRNWTPKLSTRLCADHFRPCDLNKTYHSNKVHLRVGVVPSIFPIFPTPLQITINNMVEDSSSVNDPDDDTYFDEEENYDLSKSTSNIIKVEPGLTGMFQDDASEDYTNHLARCCRIKQEPNPDSVNEEEHPDSMIDVCNSTYIKQEDEYCPNSPNIPAKIKDRAV